MNRSFQSTVQTKDPRWDESFQFYKFKPGVWDLHRLVGDVVSAKWHWVKHIQTQKAYPPIFCKNFDPDSGKFSDNGCFVCSNFKFEDPSFKTLRASTSLYCHTISRQLQQTNQPYLMPISIPIGLGVKLATAAKIPILVEGKTIESDVTDFTYGKDLYIFNDPNDPAPSNRFQLSTQTVTPLTQQEIAEFNSKKVDFLGLLKKIEVNQNKTEDILKRTGYMDILRGTTPQTMNSKVETFSPTQNNSQRDIQNNTVQMGASARSFSNAQVDDVPADFPPPPLQQYAPQVSQQSPLPYQTQGYMQPYQPLPTQTPTPPPSGLSTPVTSYSPTMQQPTSAPQPAYGIPPPPQEATFMQQGHSMPSPHEQAPQINIPNMVVAPAPVFETAAATNPSQKTSPSGMIKTQRGELTRDQFQIEMNNFSAALPRANPMKACAVEKYDGILVPACFGDYKNDVSCLKCLIRKACLEFEKA